MKNNTKERAGEVLGEASGSAGMSVGETAKKAAESWEPFTQNHDPSYWSALRKIYAEGFMRGFNDCANRKQIDPPNDSSSPTAADGNGGAERKR
jgi:hypothetical protein